MSKYSINMRVRGAGLVIKDESLLLVEYYSETAGLHYVLPGGAVHQGETIREAVRREVLEEACVEVEVGQLALVYEYAPQMDRNMHQGLSAARPPAVSLVYTCKVLKGKGKLPDTPDHDQTGVRWIPLDELDTIRLSPPIQRQILRYAYKQAPTQDAQPVAFVEEWNI